MVNGSEAVKEMLKNDDLLGRPSVGPFELLADLIDGRREFFFLLSLSEMVFRLLGVGSAKN